LDLTTNFALVVLETRAISLSSSGFTETCVLHQGRTEVRWRQGQETGLALPCSNLRSLGSKCIVLKEVLTVLLGLLSAPIDSAPGALCPFLVTPLCCMQAGAVFCASVPAIFRLIHTEIRQSFGPFKVQRPQTRG